MLAYNSIVNDFIKQSVKNRMFVILLSCILFPSLDSDFAIQTKFIRLSSRNFTNVVMREFVEWDRRSFNVQQCSESKVGTKFWGKGATNFYVFKRACADTLSSSLTQHFSYLTPSFWHFDFDTGFCKKNQNRYT